MSTGFNRIYLTWTWKVPSRKESESIFTNWSMIDNCSDSSCTEWVRVAKVLKLQTSIDIRETKRIKFTIQKVYKILSFKVRYMKSYLPLRYDVVVDMFFTMVPRKYIQETCQWSKSLGIFVDCQMEIPVFFTRIVPKFNAIVDVIMKELSQFMRYSGRL